MKRTSAGALAIAFRTGDVETLYPDREPRLLGETESGEAVWEISGVFVSPSGEPMDRAEDGAPQSHRIPWLESMLLEWRLTGWKREFADALGPKLAKRAPGFYEPPKPGWLYLACPTYELPA